MEKQKRRRGDRRDGIWLRELDSMHMVMPYILRNRADAEAFIEESVDITAINAYLEQKNAANPEFKYTLFQLIASALLRTVVLRPQLNRFVAGRRFYQRNYLSIAFVAKRQFRDDGAESLLMLYFDDDFTIETMRGKIYSEVMAVRGGKIDNSTNVMDTLSRLPRCILRIVGQALYFLDYYGRVPYDIVKEEPSYSTIFFSNLGSIKLNAAYHHLNNWGTNSLFAVIGEKGPKPYFNENGAAEMRETLNIALTLDERIADGYYYAKSIKLFKYLLQHPELLEQPANQEVDYDV